MHYRYLRRSNLLGTEFCILSFQLCCKMCAQHCTISVFVNVPQSQWLLFVTAKYTAYNTHKPQLGIKLVSYTWIFFFIAKYVLRYVICMECPWIGDLTYMRQTSSSKQKINKTFIFLSKIVLPVSVMDYVLHTRVFVT